MNLPFEIVPTDDKVEYENTIRLLVMRALIPLEGHRKMMEHFSYRCNNLIDFILSTKQPNTLYSLYLKDCGLMLNECIEKDLLAFEDDEDEDRETNAERVKQISDVYRFTEQHAEVALFKVPALLFKNVARLCDIIPLTPAESKTLIFAVLLYSHRILNNAMNTLEEATVTTLDIFYQLSVLLKLNESEIAQALSSRGLLARTSLLTLRMAQYRRVSLEDALCLISDNFANRIFCEDSKPEEWLRDMVAVSELPHLSLEDFSHLQESLDFLTPYLKQVLAEKRAGVNIFFYGIPGTGKTQVARLIASALNCQLYEVACDDEDGRSISGEQRLSALCAAQSFFKNSNAILLFDEVEDVFGGGKSDVWTDRSVAQSHKAWMNRMLEENATPVFWLGNRIDSVDPAYVRRFDWVMEFDVPPRKKREQIIRDCAQGVLSEKVITKLADCENLAPAVVTRAAKVVNTLQTTFPPDKLSWAVQYMIDKILIAQGHVQGIEDNHHYLPEHYDLTFINADADLDKITKGLSSQSRANLCFYGLPGTGKSAYSRWLSKTLEKPLITKSCSALLSAYVGGSEQNIARMFREAERDGAILLVDEIDSVLYDRNNAKRSWEISCVNEMLTQMENFRGIFIATTNRMDFIDNAAMRRFDLKVKFSPLTVHQSWQLFKQYCAILGLGEPNTYPNKSCND